MHAWRSTSLALAAGLGLLAAQSWPVRGEGEAPRPLDGLGADALARFEAGRQAFEQVHGPGDGLGPVFNGRSCAECHAVPGPGGSHGALDRQVVLFGRQDYAGGYDPLPHLGGPLRSQRTVEKELPGCDLEGERVPREANVKAHRQPPPLYGLGLIEAIPDETIRAQIEIGAATDPGEVRGRVNLVDGRVGRFGWKAEAATLEAFIGRSMLDELGLTTPLHPEETPPQGRPVPPRCDPAPDPEDDGSGLAALVDFVTLLGPQPRGPASDAVQRGAQIFAEVGCAVCHTPTLLTGPHDNPALSEREVPLYSDLLIHDLGEYLADDVVQGQAGPTDWRTTPLWGLSRKTLYLHDARTSDLAEVIELHSGEARAARYRFRKRSDRDQDDLIAFLRSL